MKMIYFIGMVCFFCTTIMYFAKFRNEKLKKEEAKTVELIETQKKLQNYLVASIELNNICERFKSSREAKAKNQKLQTVLILIH